MDWMYSNTSTTAQRGALDWYPKFYEATKPLFRELYDSVEKGDETRRCAPWHSCQSEWDGRVVAAGYCVESARRDETGGPKCMQLTNPPWLCHAGR
jgi:hypothetical protein